MAVPKSKASKARSRRRRSINMRMVAPNLISCGNCGSRIRPHQVCSNCGHYKGKLIIEPEDLD